MPGGGGLGPRRVCTGQAEEGAKELCAAASCPCCQATGFRRPQPALGGAAAAAGSWSVTALPPIGQLRGLSGEILRVGGGHERTWLVVGKSYGVLPGGVQGAALPPCAMHGFVSSAALASPRGRPSCYCGIPLLRHPTHKGRPTTRGVLPSNAQTEALTHSQRPHERSSGCSTVHPCSAWGVGRKMNRGINELAQREAGRAAARQEGCRKHRRRPPPMHQWVSEPLPCMLQTLQADKKRASGAAGVPTPGAGIAGRAGETPWAGWGPTALLGGHRQPAGRLGGLPRHSGAHQPGEQPG